MGTAARSGTRLTLADVMPPTAGPWPGETRKEHRR